MSSVFFSLCKVRNCWDNPKRKDLRIARVFFVLALLVLCSAQRHRKMHSLMRAQFIALRRLGTALLFQVKVIQGVAEFEELRSMSVQLQATEGEPHESLENLVFSRLFLSFVGSVCPNQRFFLK